MGPLSIELSNEDRRKFKNAKQNYEFFKLFSRFL